MHTSTRAHTQKKINKTKIFKNAKHNRVVLTRYNDIRGLLLFWDMRSIECPSSCFLFFSALAKLSRFSPVIPDVDVVQKVPSWMCNLTRRRVQLKFFPRLRQNAVKTRTRSMTSPCTTTSR